MLLINLIVGHTHSKADRFFSRIRAALNGHHYFTMMQFIEILIKGLPGFNVHFSHLNVVWNWRDELSTLGLPEFKGMLVERRGLVPEIVGADYRRVTASIAAAQPALFK